VTALGLVLALAVGLSLGLLGGGGSILTVPIFVYVMGFEAKQAIAMSLVVVGAVSLVGAAGHWRAGRVDLRVAGIFGLVAMVASYGGARLASYISGGVQLVLLAVVICVAAAFMMRSAARGPPAADASRESAPGTPLSVVRLMPVAVGVGLLTGLVGVGGGFLIVPALVLLGRVPIKLAIGTSLLVIAMNCASGLVGYLGHVTMPWGVVALFSVVAAAGIVGGTRLAGVVSAASLKRGFAVLLLGIGVFVLAKNHRVITDAAASTGTHAAPWSGGRSAAGGRG
jgi:uncharacterized membrane protein YfcA